MSYLLTGVRKVPQAVVFPSGTLDFCIHTGRNPVTKHPHLGTFAHKGIAKEQTQLTLFGVVVVQKLRE
jgi:hypothetical protein